MHAAGDAAGDDLARAEELLDTCRTCLTLYQDIHSITLALQALPDAAKAAEHVRAPRDFRLTLEMAARLQPGSPVTRWARGLGMGLASFGRPVGATLATFGLVGLLVGSASLGATAASRGSSFDTAASSGSSASPAEAPVAGGPATVPKATDATAISAVEATGELGEVQNGPTREVDLGQPAPNPAALLLTGSATLLVLGVALLLLATRQRRRSRAGR